MNWGEVLQTVLVALFAAVPTTILAWAALRKVTLAIPKLDKIQKTSDVIHELTNSSLTKVKADLAVALERVASLEKLVERITDRPPATETQKPQ